MIEYLTTFFSRHPFMAASITTWISNYGITAFVSSLPSPTAHSTAFYQFWFKFANAVLAGNTSRARSSAIENSPNFQDAVNKLPGPVDKPVVVVEAPKP